VRRQHVQKGRLHPLGAPLSGGGIWVREQKCKDSISSREEPFYLNHEYAEDVVGVQNDERSAAFTDDLIDKIECIGRSRAGCWCRSFYPIPSKRFRQGVAVFVVYKRCNL
jgi:hypothetical protein